MAVRKSTNGKKWRADYYVFARHPKTGAVYKKREARDFDTKKEAALWAASHALKERPKTEKRRDLASVRFVKEAVDYYLNTAKITSTTALNQQKYRSRLNHFIEWCEAHSILTLQSFTQEHAEAYAKHIIATYKRNGIEARLRLVNSIFVNEIHRQNPTISYNPFFHVKKTGFVTHIQPVFLSDAAFELLTEELGERDAAIFRVLYNTGMRSSEFTRLEWRDVHLDSLIIAESKSGTERAIPLNDDAKLGLEYFRELTGSQRYVIFGDRPASKTFVQKRFARFRERYAKLNPDSNLSDFKAHGLRRTMASHALQRGARIEDVSSVLGHADVRITQRGYATLLLSNKKNVTDLLVTKKGDLKRDRKRKSDESELESPL